MPLGIFRNDEIAIFVPLHDESKNDAVIRQGAESRLQFLEIKIVEEDEVYASLKEGRLRILLSVGNPGRGILAHRNLHCQQCSFKAIATMLSISLSSTASVKRSYPASMKALNY
jgi:hypothetical protein